MKTRSLLWSFNYAVEGIVYALRTQRNMRLHVMAATVTLVAALILRVDTLGLVAVVFAISLVFVAELVNTALEAAVDVATERYDPLAKVAKDVAAGAVLVAATTALVIGYVVLFGPLQRVLTYGLRIADVSPATVTVVALGLTVIAVLALKALSREGTFFHGGWPSGHTAVAFGAATAILFATKSTGAGLLAFFVAALVAQSRVEGEIHTIPQVILGAALGILTVTVCYQVFFR